MSGTVWSEIFCKDCGWAGTEEIFSLEYMACPDCESADDLCYASDGEKFEVPDG